MAWYSNENRSPQPSERQDNRFDRLNRQESIRNQHDRAVEESSRILKDITGSSKGFQLKSGSGWSKNRRIPRLYYINNNQTILIILQGDITRTKVDAIVNAANEHMTGGSGVDGLIHRAAGDELYQACKAHKKDSRGVRLPTGHSRILLSYNLSSTTSYIINTAGPMYNSYRAEKCAEDLYSCYKTALALANLYDLDSIGFTAISCGIFGYPANGGAGVALRAVDENADSMPVVVFVLWDDHIYDAWIQKAEELKFTLFDPEPTTPNPSKPSMDDDQGKIVHNPTVNNDQQESSTRFTPPDNDLSTQNEAEKTPENEIENLIVRLPSVEHESSDTQKTETMEEGDNLTDSNPQLTSQDTVEMRNVDPEKEDSTTNDNSQQQPTQEEINKSEGEKAVTDTVQDESHHFKAADRHDDPKNKKTE